MVWTARCCSNDAIECLTSAPRSCIHISRWRSSLVFKNHTEVLGWTRTISTVPLFCLWLWWEYSLVIPFHCYCASVFFPMTVGADCWCTTLWAKPLIYWSPGRGGVWRVTVHFLMSCRQARRNRRKRHASPNAWNIIPIARGVIVILPEMWCRKPDVEYIIEQYFLTTWIIEMHV